MINNKKKKIENQTYENYWKTTMALTKFDGLQFIRTLRIIVEHIEKYKLGNYSREQLAKGKKTKPIVHRKELERKIFLLFPNDSKDGVSTRKQINEFIKLGFISPFFNGYAPQTKKYINENISSDERKRLFSEVVYQYSSFNSSTVCDDTKNNEIKFLIRTLINRRAVNNATINQDELLGLMQLNTLSVSYASEKLIKQQAAWAEHIDFQKRKYNQFLHLKAIINYMQLFSISGTKSNFIISLAEDANSYLPKLGDTKRDAYRFALMKKAVYQQSLDIFGKKLCWLTKKEAKSLTVSHIYASAEALRNWDIEDAYNPNNALLLATGDPDKYFDSYQVTVNPSGYIYFGNTVMEDFKKYIITHNPHLDPHLLNEERKNFLSIHNKEFEKKNDITLPISKKNK